jgi:hypothetical protein
MAMAAKVAWSIVVMIALLGLLLLVFSLGVPAIQQVAVGSMVTAFVVCLSAIAAAITVINRS